MERGKGERECGGGGDERGGKRDGIIHAAGFGRSESLRTVNKGVGQYTSEYIQILLLALFSAPLKCTQQYLVVPCLRQCIHQGPSLNQRRLGKIYSILGLRLSTSLCDTGTHSSCVVFSSLFYGSTFVCAMNILNCLSLRSWLDLMHSCFYSAGPPYILVVPR